MMLATKVLIKPIITEKSYKLLKQEVYLFVVHPDANKIMIKNAFELVFGVKVASVNLNIRKRKPKALGRFRGYKKAIKKAYIKIKPGQDFRFLKETEAEAPGAPDQKPTKSWTLFKQFLPKTSPPTASSIKSSKTGAKDSKISVQKAKKPEQKSDGS